MSLSLFDTLSRGEVIADRLRATKGRPSGFDYLRIVLAISILCWHTALLCGGWNTVIGPPLSILMPFTRLLVPMFFALSGFLVAGSLERTKTLLSFLGLRAFRIIPALGVEVILSALVFGPLLTTYSLSSYFNNSQFHSYFLNILGEIHYELPGVFQSNPVHIVNGQLWTVPYELACYILLSVITIFGIFKRVRWLCLVLALYYVRQVQNVLIPFQIQHAPTFMASWAVACFIGGLIMYRCRDRIVWSGRLCLVSFVVTILLLSIPVGIRFISLPVAYMTVYIGLLNPKRDKIILSGDYSYGVYLYGFPIQQALIAISPLFLIWYWNILAAAPLTIVIAAFSWWLIEKPALDKRDILNRVEDWYLAISWSVKGKAKANNISQF
ncbi:MAG: acyltransferase family protein [Methylocella sp.]